MKKYLIQYGIIVLTINFIWISSLTAAVINATSCSQSAVQAAINLASSGDTVVIPSGSRTWSSSVDIPNSKKITLQGAGYSSTIITTSGTAISMNESGSRITGFSFMQTVAGGITIDVGGTGWRIDHCRFHHDTGHSSVHANSRKNNNNLTQNLNFQTLT